MRRNYLAINKTLSILLSLSVLSVLSLSACAPDHGKKTATKAEKGKGDIVIGAVYPKSEKGDQFIKGFNLAVDELNRRNGILGRKIRVIYRDDKLSVKQSKKIAREFAGNHNLVAVLGHNASEPAMSASIIYENNEIVYIAQRATSDHLTDHGFKFTFRAVTRMVVFAEKIVKFVKRDIETNVVDFAMVAATDEVEKQELVDKFEAEPEKNKSTLLVVEVVKDSVKEWTIVEEVVKDSIKKWTIAAFNNKEKFINKELNDNSNIELAIELKKEERDEDRIIELAASYLGLDPVKRVLVIAMNDGYGKELSNEFQRFAKEGGIEILGPITFNPWEKRIKESFLRHANNIKDQIFDDAYDPVFDVFDAIFIAASNPFAAKLIKVIRDLGVGGKIYSSEGIDGPELIEIAGDAAESVIFCTVAVPTGEKFEEFAKRFRKEYGIEPDGWAAITYDSVNLLAHCMNKVGTSVPRTVADIIHFIKDWDGVSGHYAFDGDGELLVERPLAIKTVRNGKFEYLTDIK